MASKLKRITASGKVADGPVWLLSVVLAADNADATLSIEDSTDGSGTLILEMHTGGNNSEGWRTGDKQGAYMATGIYANMTGVSAVATIEYRDM